MSAPRLPGLDGDGLWHAVRRTEPRARALADRHYSRQTPGAPEFLNAGQTLVLLTDDALALWGVLLNRDPWARVNRGAEVWRWRCAIFRNEGPHLSSDLVREATDRTRAYWIRHYGGVPTVGYRVGIDRVGTAPIGPAEVPLTTEVDPGKTRRKRDPGRCFLRAGWRVVDRDRAGLVVLQAPARP